MAAGEITPEMARAELERRRALQPQAITPEMAQAELRRRRIGAAPTGPGTLLAQGASFEFADEISSGLLAATVGTGKGIVNAARTGDLRAIPQAIGQEFVDLQDFQRAGREQFRKERPVTALVSEVAGGALGSGIGLIKAAGPVAAAATGAIQGGLYGAGSTTGGIKERAKGAGIGAAIGAGAGAAFNIIGNKAAQFFNARRAGARAPEDARRAYAAVRDALEYDLGSRSKAEAALRVWMKNGANPDELFDLAGPSLQAVQREIASQRPTSAVEFVSRIRGEAADEVRSVVAGSISKSDQSVRAAASALKIARQTQAGPLFETARQTPVPDGFVDDLIRERPAVQAAVTKAARELANSQDGTPFEVLKVAKENLDDMVSARVRAGKGAEARRLIIARDELRSRLIRLSPEYAQGLDIWSGSLAADDALNLGKKFLNPGYAADDLASDIGAMTQSEKEFLRVGVMNQLEDAIDNLKDGATAGRRFATESFRRKVRVLFDDPQDAQAFIDTIKKAEERSLKARVIDPFSGSQTEPRLRAKEAFERATQSKTGRAAEELVDNPLSTLPRKAARKLNRALSGRRAERVSDILEEVFFGSGGARLAPVAEPPPQIPFRTGPQANILLQSNDRSQ